MNKEEMKEVIKKLQKGDNFNYYTNYGYAYSLLISDADTIIDYFEEMEQENKEQDEYITYWQKETGKRQDKIDKAIEYINWWVEDNKKMKIGLTIAEVDGLLEILKDSDVDD